VTVEPVALKSARAAATNASSALMMAIEGWLFMPRNNLVEDC
jgi:hypothetical protein